MSKVTFEFDTDEDSNHLEMVYQAPGMHSLLWEFDMWLRNSVKYAPDDELVLPKSATLEEAREKLHEFMADHGVNLDKVE